MALRATERRIDLVMADQAIRHLRKYFPLCRNRGGVRSLQTPVTRAACVFGIELRAQASHGAKVRLGVDGGRDQRRQVTHLQVLLMAKLGNQARGRCRF